jgi:hypothetical protein
LNGRGEGVVEIAPPVALRGTNAINDGSACDLVGLGCGALGKGVVAGLIAFSNGRGAFGWLVDLGMGGGVFV